MNTHAAFQQSFARRIWSDPSNEESNEERDEEPRDEAQQTPSRVDATMQRAFAVYRNTAMKGCIDALQANHPAVAQLVGEAWFRSVAALYVRERPPAEPRLMHYGTSPDATPGGTFADFLARCAPAAALPYLPGVARLDALWTVCHTAADAAAADPAWLASMDPADLGGVRLRPHPAARWVWCENLPVYTIWSATRQGVALDDALVWQGEGTLLTRPADSVLWSPLSQAGCALLEACAAGATLAEAAAAAQRIDVHCDLAALLAQLLRQGALTQPLTQPLAQGATP